MLSFREFLLIEKNLHQLHLEQYALRGIYSLRKAVEILQDLRDKLHGNAKYKAKNEISIKFDGAPAVIFGINPENGKFFVGTKGVFNKKTPKLAYSYADINELYGEGPTDQLKVAFKYLKDKITKGVWQGDFLWSRDSVGKNEIDREFYYTFRPNTITYAIKANSDLGKRIAASHAGIVIHTEYVGSTIESLQPQFVGVDLTDKSSTKLVILSPKMQDTTGVINFTAKEEAAITQKLAEIVKEYNNLDHRFFEEFEDNALDLFEIYVNAKVRKDTFVDSQTVIEDFVNFLSEYYERKFISKLKSAAGRAKRQTELEDKIAWIKSNVDKVVSLTKIYQDLAAAKNMFVHKFDEIDHDINSFIETDKGFKCTSHEGYCAIQQSGDIVKLVDRLEFSKNNFNIAKNWK